jgi:5-methylthioadenosine/S-adenosylhomocysteine deaminase
LASGTFNFHAAHTSGIRITLGTDGAASNNSLSLLAETKTAALLAKSTAGRPEALPLSVIDHAVTDVAAAALGFSNAGKIEVGADADLLLIDLHHPAFVGPGDRDANFLYGADSSVIDTVICNGRILMQARKVEGEEEILAHAHRVALALQA